MAILWPINVNDCILVLPPDGWQEKILDKLKSNSLHDEQAAILRRVLGETSAPLELDRIGRFGLSENLANGVGLEKGGEAVFVGCVTNFEIWNSKRFDAAAPYDKSQAADFAKKIL